MSSTLSPGVRDPMGLIAFESISKAVHQAIGSPHYIHVKGALDTHPKAPQNDTTEQKCKNHESRLLRDRNEEVDVQHPRPPHTTPLRVPISSSRANPLPSKRRIEGPEPELAQRSHSLAKSRPICFSGVLVSRWQATGFICTRCVRVVAQETACVCRSMY
jgi:hypothetical protein